MDTRQAYNLWASQYDSNQNKTRDLEAVALRAVLSPLSFEHCLEWGCGTGKNTLWLMHQAKAITAVDLSEEMLAKAKAKVAAPQVNFVLANMTEPWGFGKQQYDLVTFSLVLEHIEQLEPVLREASEALCRGGWVYIGELHPYRQYGGSKARFDTEAGRQVVPCFNHHISDFTQAAKKCGLSLIDLEEHFDENDRSGVPRILSLLLRKE